jgi:plastocyanin
MDRVKTSQLRFAVKIAAGVLAWSAIGAGYPHASSADVVFAKPQNEQFSATENDYPESHFGVSPGYAVRAVNQMESENSDGVPTNDIPSRSPAGLESSGGANGGVGSEGTSGTMSRSMNVAQVSPHQIPTTDVNPSIDSASVAARKGVQEVALIAGDLGFFPKTVFVSRDVPVRLFVTSASKNTLCIMMDSFQVRKQVRAQKIEEITFTPSTPGRYRFYCPVNGMEGTMIVKELASAPPSQ